MKITLAQGDFGTYEIVPGPDKEQEFIGKLPGSILVQTDWDFPGLAATFGWNPCSGCRHSCKGSTDGTIDCRARTASEHIGRAREYLDQHDGKTVEDPGYFQTEGA